MARDIEVDLHVNDDTAAGLNSAAARLEAHEKKIKADGDKTAKAYSDRLVKSVNQVSPALAKKLEETFKDKPLTLKDGTKEGFEKATANLKHFEDRVKKGGKDASKNFASSLVQAVEGVAPAIAKEIGQAIEQAGGKISGLGKKATEDIAGTSGQAIRQFGSRFLRIVNDIAPAFANLLADAARAAGPPVALALVGALIPALSVVGGALAAVISGAGALTGIAGGVALAFKDPRVKNAGKSLGKTLLGGLQEDASSLVTPLIAQFAKIEARFVKLRPIFRAIFDGAGDLLGPLVDGVLAFSEHLARGIKAAVEGAGPVIDALSRGFDYLGGAIENMFTDLADDGVAAGQALDLVFKVVGNTIIGVTNTLEGLTKLFGFGAKAGLFGQEIRTSFIAAEVSANLAAAATAQARVAIDTVGVSADNAASQLGIMNTGLQASSDAMNEAATAASGLFGAVTDVGQSYADANKAIAENGATLSVNTQAGRDNRKALKNLADDIVAYREGLAASSISTEEFNIKMGDQRARLYQTALGMTHSAAAANKLTDELLGIPDAHATAITTPGAPGAIGNAINMHNKVNAIPGSKPVKVTADTGSAVSRVQDFRSQLLDLHDRVITVSVHADDSRLASVERRLARVSGESAGGDGFAFNPDGGSRVGGARQIAVESSVAVNLDGRPFREYTTRQVHNESKRTDFRNRVGRRDS